MIYQFWPKIDPFYYLVQYLYQEQLSYLKLEDIIDTVSRALAPSDFNPSVVHSFHFYFYFYLKYFQL